MIIGADSKGWLKLRTSDSSWTKQELCLVQRTRQSSRLEKLNHLHEVLNESQQINRTLSSQTKRMKVQIEFLHNLITNFEHPVKKSDEIVPGVAEAILAATLKPLLQLTTTSIMKKNKLTCQKQLNCPIPVLIREKLSLFVSHKLNHHSNHTKK